MYHHHRKHFWGLFSVPRAEWKSISDETLDITQFGILRMAVLSLVPSVSFLIGITQIGWSLDGSDFHQVALMSAIPMAIAFYVLIVAFTLLMAYFTFSMEKTFGDEASFGRCLLFVTYTATPMCIAGLIGLVPIVWLCMTILLPAVCYSVYLLYLGIPIYMDIDEGKGYVVSTSIISAGLCMLVVFNVITVIMWTTML